MAVPGLKKRATEILLTEAAIQSTDRLIQLWITLWISLWIRL
jgi:hypothetical protein